MPKKFKRAEPPTPAPSAAPTDSGTEVEPTPCYTLTHPTVYAQYEFSPCGDVVTVVFRDRSVGSTSHQVPIEEARQLWCELVAKGYERL